MQQQNDWYTGIDYFQSYKEQDIQVEEQSLAQPVPLTRHERVELWYVLKGDGDILVNGVLHTVQQDSFLCLYAHHLYEVSCVRKPLRVLRIQFYIGLFMHAMWEKHPEEEMPLWYMKLRPVFAVRIARYSSCFIGHSRNLTAMPLVPAIC